MKLIKSNQWLLVVILTVLVGTVQAESTNYQDSGKWQFVHDDGRGHKTFMDTKHFQAGFPASMLVKTDVVQCHSKYRMHTCAEIALFDVDCKKGQLKYVKDMTRDVVGNVVKEWDNVRAKMVYPPPGTGLETLLIRACQHNKKVLK